MTAEDTYKTITEPSEGIYTEKRSKFIAIALPVRTIDEIKVHLETYQKKYYDARHVCYAYMLGAARKDFRANDNGEPSGTAGRPILEVLTGSGIRGLTLVVTRYFGGTLLGTGGLVRAYTQAAQAGIHGAVCQGKDCRKENPGQGDGNHRKKIPHPVVFQAPHGQPADRCTVIVSHLCTSPFSSVQAAALLPSLFP